MFHTSLRFIFLFSIIFVTSFSCKKFKLSHLPSATQQGANTVGFIVNDNVWVPYMECSWFQDPCGRVSANVQPPIFGFQIARDYKGKSSSLTIWTNGATITSIGNKIDSIGAAFLAEDWDWTNGDYNEIVRPGSKFIITRYYPVAEVISGEFELILKEQIMNGRTIVLKSGRFDFKFYTCICD